MADDFRALLKEDINEYIDGERWFNDIEIGDIFFLSIQASALHGSTPAALLDDIQGYEAFQVTIQSKHGVFAHGKRGVWQHLESKSWWPLFEADSPILYVAENVPVPTVQLILEDLQACVAEHTELKPRKCGGLKAC